MKPLLNFGLFLLACMNFYNVTAQISLTNTVTTSPITVDVCGETALFTYEIDNVSSFTLFNNEVLFSLPTGMSYVPGSVVGCSEVDISNLNQPEFSFPDFSPTDPIIEISFSASVGCDAIGFLQGGGTFQNDYEHTYSYGAAQSNTETTTSVTYNVNYPFLLISNVTNQSYSANSGDTYSQCVTISNSGQAPVSDLWFVNAHGLDLTTANYALGTVMSTGSNYDSVYVDGTGFLGVGNGDMFLDPGESVTICYDVTVNGCDFVSSTFSTTWGCDGQFCQESGSTANVVFPNLIPTLEFTVTQNTSDNCLGESDTYSISIENTGSGIAYNVLVDIFNHANGNQTNTYQGYLVPGSFTYTINGNASSVPTLTTNAVNSVYSCVPANSPSDVTATIPEINPGDVVVITFEHFLCCPDYCSTTHSIPGLGFNAFYENICGFTYNKPFVQIYNYDRIYATIFNDNSPFNATGGQSTLMNFGINPAGNWLPSGTGASYIAEFTIPSCGVWDGQSFFTHWNGSNINPDSTVVNGSTITSYYPFPMTLEEGTFHVGFILDCDPTTGCMMYIDSMAIPCLGIVQDAYVPNNPLDVTMELFYVPETTCGCTANLCSLTIPIILDCPPTGQFVPTEGIACQDFDFKRTSYGLPDNNNDGQPDAGPLDLSLIRTDRAVFGDTLTATAFGVIDTINGNSNYQYFLAKMDIVEGVNISAIGGQIEIYDDNTGSYFTENVALPTVTTNNPDRYFEFEVDASTFVNAPASFLFEQNDSIWVDIDFRVTQNPGGSIDILEMSNSFFVTNNPAAVDTTGACWCQALLSVYGYYYTLWAPNTLYPSECDSILFTENYYLSVGPCCSNYAGGTTFGYEYRNFATLDTMEIVLPVGYYFSSARIRERRTTGNGVSGWSPWQNITPSANIPPIWPTQVGGNHYKFPTDQLYTNGSFPYPDEGFYGTFEFYATPSCEVEQDVPNDVGYIADFGTDTLWWDTPTSNTSQDITRDIVTYEGAELFIQATLPFIQSQTNQATWTVTVQNVSAVAGSNIFLGLDNISGNLNVSSIYHVNSSTAIPNNGGDIFYVGDIPVGAVWQFEITADIDGCGLDSIQVYAGWNCASTPVDLVSYPCLNTTPSIVLTVLPLTPLFISQLSVLNNTMPLCDVTTMTIEGENIQLGWGYDVDLTVTLPTGMSVVPGSGVACFPAGSSNCVAIPDPVGIGNSQILWDSLVFNNVIGSNGFPGFDSTNTIAVTFDIMTNCDYTSGSFVTAGYQAYAGCGDQSGQEIGSSPSIFIQGATVPFDAQIYLETTSLSPCEDSTLLEVWVSNDGMTNFGTSDSVTVILPEGFYYVPGSTVNINTGPTNLTPLTTAVGTDTYLTWPIPEVLPGDSTHFSIYYQGDPSTLECEALEISAYSTTVNNLLCISNGMNCALNTIATDTSTYVFIYKGFLELLNGSGTVTLGPGNNETIEVTYDISNFGNTISPSYPTTVNYYSDINSNGVLDAMDPLILAETYTVLLDSNATVTMIDTILVPAGSGCQILVELQADQNDCSCLSDTLLITPELQLNYSDTTVCANVPIVLGDVIPAGYTQMWLTLDPAESGALSSMSGPTPTALWTPNPSNQPDTIDIQIMTDRGGCFSLDTMQLIVYPSVLVDAGEDTSICDYDAINLDGSLLSYADSMYWTQLSGPSVLAFSDASDTLSSVSGFVAGTYELVLTGVSDFCTSHTDTMTITAFDVDLSELSLTNVSCYGFADGEIELEATNGVAPYVISLDGGAFTPNTVYGSLDVGSYTFVVQDFIGCYDTLTSSITQPDTLTLSLTGTDITCSTFLDGSVTSTPVGGSVPYSYAWSNAAVTPDIFGLDSAQYILTITDDNGCTASDSVNLTSPPPVLVNAGLDDSLCHYDAFTLNGMIISFVDSTAWEQISGPSAVTFADINDLNTSVSGLVPGVYEIVLNGYNDICPGHSDTMTLSVFDVDLSELSLTNVSCYGFADGEIELEATNGVAPYVISLDGGAFTPNTVYGSLDVGSYTFVVQDFIGCYDTLTSSITQPDTLTLSLTGTDITCSTFLDGSVTSTPVGGTVPYSYAWSNAAVTPDIFGLDSAQYILTITDDNGCTASDSVNLISPPPVLVNAGLDDSLCHYDAFNLNGMIISFVDSTSWEQISGPSAVTFADINDLNTSVSGLVPGVYEIVLNGYNDICPGHSDTMTLSVFDVDLSELNLTNVSCYSFADGEIELEATNGVAPYVISLDGGAFTPNTVYGSLDVGSYTFVVQDFIGCYDTLTSSITQPDTLTLSLTGTDITCSTFLDGTLTSTPVGGSVPYSYAWSNAAVTPDIFGLDSGQYILTITDDNGCTTSDSVNLTSPPPVLVNAGLDDSLCHYDAFNLNGMIISFVDSTSWEQISGPSAVTFADINDLNTSVTGLVPGVYEIVLNGYNDICPGHSDTMTLSVFDVDLSELSLTNVSCYGFADGEIELEATNGVAPYVISLDGGAFTPNTVYGSLDVGSYTFVVQDFIGCYDTLTSSITQPDTLTLSLTGTDITCSTFLDGSVTSTPVGGTVPYSYAWSNAAVTPDIFGLDSGQYILTITDDNGCTTSDSVNLTSPPPVLVNAGLDDSLCHYDAFNLNGMIISFVDSTSWEQISGPSPVTFADINDLNTSVSGFVDGVYEIVLHGYNDICPGHSDTLIINAFAPQISQVSLSNVSCFNVADGEVNVAGSNGLAPYLFSMNGGMFAPTSNYPSLDSGAYEFILQDDFGCLDTLSSFITQPDSITIALDPTNISCFGFTDGAIDATIAGGTPMYTFSWSNGQTTQNASGLGAGWHVLTVTDANGCIAVDSIELLAPPPLNLTATIDSVNCNGNSDGNIDVLVTGGTLNYSYAWTGGIVTEDLIGYPAGMYDLVVTDGNACTISASYEIFEPDALNYSVSLIQESCENLCDGEIEITSITGGTGVYTILLDGTDQFGNQLFTDVCSGNYTLEVQDENGCSLSTVETINPGLLYPDASFTIASMLCAYDTTVTIVAIDPSGTWTANGNPSTLDINPANWGPGSYDIEHIIPGTCPDTSIQTITINELPVPNIWADQLAVCNPDVITLNNLGTPGVNCQWNINGWISNDCGPIAFGTDYDGYFDVELTVTDANGCTVTQSIVDYLYFSNSPTADFYVEPDSTVSIYDPTIGFVNTSFDAITYEWLIDGSAYSTNENTSYTNTAGLPGSYAVTLVAMDEYGCTDTITRTINYQDEPVLFVPNTFTPDGNSLNNTFFPVGNGVQITEWLIFNRWGETIFISNTNDSEWDGTYNGALVQDGVYTWKITYVSENSGTPVTMVGHVNVLK